MHAIVSWRENIWGNLSTSSSAAKKSNSEKCWKIVCFPGLITSKLQQGPFCREKVFCWSCCKLRVSSGSVKPRSRFICLLCKEFHKNFFKLASMELSAYMLNNFNRLQDPNFGCKIFLWKPFTLGWSCSVYRLEGDEYRTKLWVDEVCEMSLMKTTDANLHLHCFNWSSLVDHVLSSSLDLKVSFSFLVTPVMFLN